MIIKPKVRGFVCVTAHPEGCAAHVQEWIDHVKAKGPITPGPKKVLVIGIFTLPPSLSALKNLSASASLSAESES